MTEFREKAVLMDEDGIRRALMRIAHEIVEKNHGTEHLVLVGIRKRGVPIAARLGAEIAQIEGRELPRGVLDITLYRDDLNELAYQPIVHTTEIPLDITDKTVILVDDVLYTGRSIRAALSAIQSFGRPSEIELLVLIDRRFSRHLPIQPDYSGKQVDAINDERVVVHWKQNDGKSQRRPRPKIDRNIQTAKKRGQHEEPAGPTDEE